jgi:DUF4097 and DUF4098 domain-containing protein YvlB
MKKTALFFLIGAGILYPPQKVDSQEFTEHISKEFSLTGKQTEANLFIYNISGFIKVEGYAGNKVIFEIDKTISAENTKSLEAGKKEFRLGFDMVHDSIIAYIAEPFDSRPHRHWNGSDNQEVEYNFNVNFTVKVPEGMNLHISTVNDGIISVNNVFGALHINNVNAEIVIKNAKGPTRAHTVNGDVIVTYLSNPAEESSYYTINGNIDVSYQPDLSAEVQFKSMNGDLFTNFQGAEILPATVNKIRENRDGAYVYKLNSSTTVRFGKGGRLFKFETLNGNVYIKKQS